MIAWLKSIFCAADPKPVEWDLYVFPGGKVGEATTRAWVYAWMLANLFTLGELRAINRSTGKHIVR